MDGDGDFFQIKNMEASESAVPDSGKDRIDQECLKFWWEDEEMPESNTTLHHRRRHNDRSIAEDQDSEQDTNYD